MSDQPEDLQQWLNQLRKRAESERGRGRSASSAPQPNAQRTERARPLEEVLRDRIREAVGEPVRPRRSAPGYPEPARREATASAHPDVSAARRRVAEESRRREERQRREDALRKKGEARRREAEHKQKEAARRKRMAAARASQAAAAGGGGLTGDPVRDLQAGAAVLREAILLKEILGPPVALRDPGESHFG